MGSIQDIRDTRAADLGDAGRTAVAARVAGLALAFLGTTLAAGFLEGVVGIADASPVYLIAVVLAAGVLGTWAAVATSLAAFLAYDFLFTLPRFTFAVSDPAEWLSLLLFLIVAVVIGRLTARLRERADTADRRAREGESLVAISRDIVAAASFAEAAALVADRVRHDAEMEAVWVVLHGEPEEPVVVAGTIAPGAAAAVPYRLVPSQVDGSSDWLRVHDEPDGGDDTGVDRYLVPILGEGGGEVGTLQATRPHGDPIPGRGARRILTLAADQLGLAHAREALVAELTTAEVERQSDALRAAILDSVSHDLRTPIAGIRALAGGLVDPAVEPAPAAVRAAAAEIDAEGARLGELVNGLLDMGRIQAGALAPDLQPYDLGDLVETALRHHPAGDPAHEVATDLADDIPPVLVDAVLFDVALGNVIDNAGRHTPPEAPVRLAARHAGGRVEIAVDDGGPGVPAEALPFIFERFYRVPASGEPARHGMGVGLAIARGFVEAMGGEIDAEPSDLGGLRIRIRLAAVPEDVLA